MILGPSQGVIVSTIIFFSALIKVQVQFASMRSSNVNEYPSKRTITFAITAELFYFMRRNVYFYNKNSFLPVISTFQTNFHRLCTQLLYTTAPKIFVSYSRTKRQVFLSTWLPLFTFLWKKGFCARFHLFLKSSKWLAHGLGNQSTRYVENITFFLETLVFSEIKAVSIVWFRFFPNIYCRQHQAIR